MDYAGPMLDSPFGSVPINLFRQLLRGPAILVAIAALQLIATH
jgi:hypothetical protein